MTKKNKVLICLAIIISVIAIIIGIFFPIFKNAFFIRMPSSHICKQLEKDVPIGTSADDVIDFVEANGIWTNHGYAMDPDDPNEFILYDEGVAFCFGDQRDPNSSYSFHSFSGFDYESNPRTAYGSYNLYVDLGDIPWKDAPTILGGRCAKAYFVFDEKQELIDIIVCKEFFGP